MTRLALVLALLASPALAAPPVGADGSLSEWYRGLRQPGTGYGCCSEADCRPYPSRRVAGHYEVLVAGEWLEVPPDRIIHDEVHPAGQAVACIVAGRVFCFVPAGAGI